MQTLPLNYMMAEFVISKSITEQKWHNANKLVQKSNLQDKDSENIKRSQIFWIESSQISPTVRKNNYLKCVMEGSVVHVKEALCQRHHGAEPVTPQHLLCQVRAPRLTRHPCTNDLMRPFWQTKGDKRDWYVSLKCRFNLPKRSWKGSAEEFKPSATCFKALWRKESIFGVGREASFTSRRQTGLWCTKL